MSKTKKLRKEIKRLNKYIGMGEKSRNEDMYEYLRISAENRELRAKIATIKSLTKCCG